MVKYKLLTEEISRRFALNKSIEISSKKNVKVQNQRSMVLNFNEINAVPKGEGI